MKLHESDNGSNPLKVRMVLAEKGADIERVKYDLLAGEHRVGTYPTLNSLKTMPALELDDGTVISESIAICRYLDHLYPEPPLFGRTPLESAQVEMWCRRVELEVGAPCVAVIHHTAPFFADRIEQIPQYADAQRSRAAAAFAWLESELADGRDYVAGEQFSMADILLMTVMRNARMMKIALPDNADALSAWEDRVADRPSAAV